MCCALVYCVSVFTEAQALLLEKSDSDNRELRHELERLRCHSREHAVASGAADFVHTATDRCAPSGISDTDLVAMQLELVQVTTIRYVVRCRWLSG